MRNNEISRKRQDHIMEIIQRQGEVNVKRLSYQFHVTPITIRRDLDSLTAMGRVHRIHGGAILKRDYMEEALFDEKGLQNMVEKRRIAATAAKLIEDNALVFLNSGSTTLEVLKQITDKHVRIITNNAASTTLQLDPQVELFLVGGEYRKSSQSLVGDMAIQSLSNVISSTTILGTNGINEKFGLTTMVQQEIGVNRMMVDQCNGPIVVLADSSKIGVISNFSSVPIEKISILITDDKADKQHLESFEALGIHIITV